MIFCRKLNHFLMIGQDNSHHTKSLLHKQSSHADSKSHVISSPRRKCTSNTLSSLREPHIAPISPTRHQAHASTMPQRLLPLPQALLIKKSATPPPTQHTRKSPLVLPLNADFMFQIFAIRAQIRLISASMKRLRRALLFTQFSTKQHRTTAGI